MLALNVRDGIASLHLDAPPVNALDCAVRRMLMERLKELTADPAIGAICLTTEGRHFSAGADIREFEKSPKTPLLGELCRTIENTPKPVIVGLQGPALGGGAEIALAAHYRLALPQAALGLPEITLGLIPGAGGTQRLPRIVGPEAALAMMIDGRPVPAETAESMGLIDGIVDEDLAQAIHSFAQGLLSHGLGPRPTAARRDRMTDGAGWLAAINAARTAHAASPVIAARHIIDSVEAALLLPFDLGLTFERDSFESCLAHPQSRALRHVFLAERQVSPTLVSKDEQGRRQLAPQGATLAAQLLRAQLTACEVLLRLGATEALLDATHVDQGFESGPYGGTTGGAGAEGAALWRRINAAVMAEGGRQIGAGAARNASDIDAVAVLGLGYPRLTGGPMKSAEIIGLLPLRNDMTTWRADSLIWDVPPVLTEAVRFAGGFDAVPAPISG
ncbi:MAG: enoyl-CoA hydratase-related protein [Rhodobacterales bacterium]|nr:enoyl-CoA hydratase-related protein [Rhodobacterales bacterium]